MTWGVINASADTPAKLETAINDAATEHFDRIVDQDTDEQRKHAKKAAKIVKELAKEMEFPSMMEATISGQVGVPGTGVPSAISISLLDLNPPPADEQGPEIPEAEPEVVPTNGNGGN